MKEEKNKVDIYCILFSSYIYVLCLFLSLTHSHFPPFRIFPFVRLEESTCLLGLLASQFYLKPNIFYDNKMTTTINNTTTILQFT